MEENSFFMGGSLSSFIMTGLPTVLSVFIFIKYKFSEEIKWFYFSGCLLSLVVLNYLTNQAINFIGKLSDVGYLTITSSQSMGGVLSAFLLILLLYYKQVDLHKGISQVGGSYLISLLVENCYHSFAYYSRIGFLMNRFVSLLIVTFFSVLISIVFFRLIEFFANQRTKLIYRPLTSWLTCLLVFVIILLQMAKSSPKSEQVEQVFDRKEIILPQDTVFDTEVVNTDIFLFSAVTFFILIMVVINHMYQKEKQVRIERERTKELKAYIETIEMIRDEVLSYQHDYDNIFTGISGYIYEEKINKEELRRYYEKSAKKVLRNEGINVIKLLNLKNIDIPEIKGILSQKILQARQKDILVQFEASEPVRQIPMEMIDLTRCLGILLDNAIEAASKSEGKQLTIAFIFLENQLLLVIKNTFDNSQIPNYHNVLKPRFSSKQASEKHGFGLTNLRNIVKMYKNIALRTTIQDQDFIQEIRFNLGERE